VKTIVVVDDDEVFGRLMSTVLDLEGYRPVVVKAVDDVVPTVREEGPALVLMDFHIHDRDTLGVLRELKDDEVLKDTPVILTSGSDRSVPVLEAGADSFIAKPFRPSELLSEISGLIASSEREGGEHRTLGEGQLKS
jgi:DNA-binding response OmpR family regulator